jgi:hypothetical protein
MKYVEIDKKMDHNFLGHITISAAEFRIIITNILNLY